MASATYDFTATDDLTHAYARAAMDGFDELPSPIRHLLNYGPASLLRPGECRRVCVLVAQHGAERCAAFLALALDKAAHDPNAFPRDRHQHR